MDKQFRFLKYLRKIGSGSKLNNINDILKKLKLHDADEIYEFLNDLEGDKLIQWTDGRPRIFWQNSGLHGTSPDANAPFDFQARITLDGLKFLREDNFKSYTKTTAVGAAIAAFLAILVSIYFGIKSSDKDKEIATLEGQVNGYKKDLEIKNDSLKNLAEEYRKLRQAKPSSIDTTSTRISAPK